MSPLHANDVNSGKFLTFHSRKASQMFNDGRGRDDYPSSPHNSAHQEMNVLIRILQLQIQRKKVLKHKKFHLLLTAFALPTYFNNQSQQGKQQQESILFTFWPRTNICNIQIEGNENTVKSRNVVHFYLNTNPVLAPSLWSTTLAQMNPL